jgi:hypothetical protein
VTTLSALLDVSHKSPGDDAWDTEVATVDVEVADGQCSHTETICPDCAPEWSMDYTFLEPFPWDVTEPT